VFPLGSQSLRPTIAQVFHACNADVIAWIRYMGQRFDPKLKQFYYSVPVHSAEPSNRMK